MPWSSFNLLAKGLYHVQGSLGEVVMNINSNLQAMGLYIVKGVKGMVLVLHPNSYLQVMGLHFIGGVYETGGMMPQQVAMRTRQAWRMHSWTGTQC